MLLKQFHTGVVEIQFEDDEISIFKEKGSKLTIEITKENARNLIEGIKKVILI